MTLRTRLTLAVAAIVAAAVVSGAYASHYTTSRELRSEADKFLLSRATRFTNRGPGFGGGGGGPGGGPGSGRPNFDLGRAPGGDRDGGGPLVGLDAVTQVLDANGAVISSVAGQPTLPVDGRDRALARRAGTPRLRDVHVGEVHYRMLTASLAGGGAVQLGRSLTETDDVLSVLRNRFVVIALAGTVLAALAGWVLARRTTKPIQRLTDTAERVAATQDLTTPIPVRGDDEVGRLASSFNTMLVALDTSRRQQQRLVADASHELRTPLTAIRTNIEFLERADTMDAEQRRELLTETRLELDELTGLATELVELATDARNDEPVADVDLAEVTSDVAARYRRRSGRAITLTTTDAAVVEGRRAMLDRAVSNLVDNALKFSAPPGAVDVTVAGACIEVADRGPGVPADERGRVFDRFYRTTAARGRPGSGLGLSIVRQIAEVHHGTVSLHERDGGGTVARLELPAPS